MQYGSSIFAGAVESSKTYTVQAKETIGKIASRFNLPSWKYLYDLNKNVIGDNPDILKEGLSLTIPVWQSTSLARMLEEKGQVAELWFSGFKYRNPWVAFSASMIKRSGSILTIKDASGKPTTKFKEPVNWIIRDCQTGNELGSGEIGESDELQAIIPNSPNAVLEIDGKICHL
jgi:hypothetical protein